MKKKKLNKIISNLQSNVQELMMDAQIQASRYEKLLYLSPSEIQASREAYEQVKQYTRECEKVIMFGGGMVTELDNNGLLSHIHVSEEEMRFAPNIRFYCSSSSGELPAVTYDWKEIRKNLNND